MNYLQIFHRPDDMIRIKTTNRMFFSHVLDIATLLFISEEEALEKLGQGSVLSPESGDPQYSIVQLNRPMEVCDGYDEGSIVRVRLPHSHKSTLGVVANGCVALAGEKDIDTSRIIAVYPI